MQHPVPHYAASGEVVCIDGLIRDISKRKRAERERNEMQALVQSARKHESLSVLARGIAHDFKNIVTVMSGFAAVALGRIPPEHPAAECLRHIRAAGERAVELVNRVLLFSQDRAEGSRPMRFQDAAHETVTLLDSILPPRVRLLSRIASDCNPICADPTQIHQVVMNLCTNALHAMQNGQGGTLTVELEEVRLDAPWATRQATLLPGRYVRLSVADTGCGIPPEIQERIFEPYFTTRNGGEGTGLGLATVQGIITSYGGAITVQSEVGRGSVFRVYLPTCGSPPVERAPEPGGGHVPELVMDAVVDASSEASAAVEPFEPVATGLDRPWILLVDVDAAILDLSQMALDTWGIESCRLMGARKPCKAMPNRPSGLPWWRRDGTSPIARDSIFCARCGRSARHNRWRCWPRRTRWRAAKQSSRPVLTTGSKNPFPPTRWWNSSRKPYRARRLENSPLNPLRFLLSRKIFPESLPIFVPPGIRVKLANFTGQTGRISRFISAVPDFGILLLPVCAPGLDRGGGIPYGKLCPVEKRDGTASRARRPGEPIRSHKHRKRFSDGVCRFTLPLSGHPLPSLRTQRCAPAGSVARALAQLRRRGRV